MCGAGQITIGPVPLHVGNGVAGIEVKGLGSAWIETNGTVCGSPAGAGGKLGWGRPRRSVGVAPGRQAGAALSGCVARARARAPLAPRC